LDALEERQNISKINFKKVNYPFKTSGGFVMVEISPEGFP